ncbi:hypothetical protein MNBD_GAMMA11-1344 [hydrothermal vent metagenome]|uniref:Uncharacterized protein n=1 Tax=hydrothermal vent metagenome TaxID=652676 RepID=A0A3B0X3M9_9ZZZZ
MPRRISRSIKYLTILLFCLLTIVISTFSAASESDERHLLKQIDQLETEFKALSTTFYKTASSQASGELNAIESIDLLLTKTSRLDTTRQSIAAIQLLYTNKEVIKNNLDHKAIFKFTQLLLENNEWNLAKELLNAIQDEGDRSLSATTQFIFAKYHAPRNEWREVSQLLDGVFTELSPENTDYAYLLKGSALQHLKKHREAIESYKKIPDDSLYYSYAQLNTAIANIRQGWWTDARKTIHSLIKHTQKGTKDELTNRLYLVLGYALLQKEYYRDARDSFRHIGINSRYTNRALLGIGLSATNQGDYVGGLNALSILKDKKTSDLSVDESYLLIPYVYEKLQQQLTVTTSYSEAMKYYQRRIKKITALARQHIKLNEISYTEYTTNIIIKNNSLDYGKHFPKSFLNNHHRLAGFLAASKSRKLDKKIGILSTKYDELLQDIVHHLMEERIEHLKSYLNQSRYGLAQIYDKSGDNTPSKNNEGGRN